MQHADRVPFRPTFAHGLTLAHLAALAAFLTPAPLVAQQTPDPIVTRVVRAADAPDDASPLATVYLAVAEDGRTPGPHPTLLLLADDPDTGRFVATRLARGGLTTAVGPVRQLASSTPEERRTWASAVGKELRISLPVARNRLHLVAFGDAPAVTASAEAVEQAIGFELLSSTRVGGTGSVEAPRSAKTGAQRAPGSTVPPFVRHVVGAREADAEDAVDAELVLTRLRVLLEGASQVFLPEDEDARQVEAALDQLHDAATRADAERYFGLFTDDGVFLGTDATERWTVDEFREWAGFAFERRSAWMFTPLVRHVSVDANHAWFDEELDSRSYGRCRGSGVLRRGSDGRWRVAQYNLTVPVPNDLLADVVARIRAHDTGSDSK